MVKMPHSSHKHTRRKRRFFLLFKLFLIALITFVILGAATLAYLYQKNLPIADSDRNSRLLDAQGQVIATFSSSGRSYEPVQLDQISPYLIQATLAVEDRKFYHHTGFDIKGMARAIIVNIEQMSRSQGASTLTQQLARNLYLSHEKTWSRKLKEAKYTIQLEMKYNKDEILQMYLNEIYYGHGAYGIEAAASMYFGKRASDLTLAESALLAGIPKGPSYYSPYKNKEAALKRQKIVLSAMTEMKAITEQAAKEAASEVLSFKPQGQQKTVVTAPYFRDYVRHLVTSQLGISEERLYHGGLNIYTTLDSHAQKAAEDAVTKEMDPSSELEAALVSIDPRSGHIKAMVGGKNYRDNQYNHVLVKTRQPGSSFKPIMYLTALSSQQLTGISTFSSEPTLFHYDNNRKTYQPSNFGDKYLGEITMRKAIAASDNIYAVNTIMKLGPEKVVEMARQIGITSPLQAVPSLALGTSPVSPLEMAASFGVISNNGEKVPTLAVLRITDAAGAVLYQAPDSKAEQVVSPAAAYVLTHLMEGVFEAGGTGNRVSSMLKRPVAGKTGTTDSDAWMVGYTPELSTAVWVGYDKGRAIQTTDGRRAAPIFARFTEKALENIPPKIFPIPDGVVNVYIDPESGKLATEDCPEKVLEVFIEGTEPTEYCSTHVSEEVKPLEADAAEEEHSWWSDFKRWLVD